MKKLWLRIGAEIEIPDDFVVNENSIGELEDIIDKKIMSGEYEITGETYAPFLEDERYVNKLFGGCEPEVYFVEKELMK